MKSPPLRWEHIQARVAEIQASVARIREYTALSDDAFFADERNFYSVVFLLLRTIEAAASICTHILARMAKSAPSSYSDCFLSLADLGVIEPELAQRLVRAARLRNLLIHQYWDTDEQRVLELARNNIEDFVEFVRQVNAWVKRVSGEGGQDASR